MAKKSGTGAVTKAAKKGTVKKKAGASAKTAAKSGAPRAKKAASPKATRTGAVKKAAGVGYHQGPVRVVKSAAKTGTITRRQARAAVKAVMARLAETGELARMTVEKFD